MKKRKRSINRDINTEEKKFRTILPKSHMGGNLTWWEYNYSVRRQAITYTYRENKYTPEELNCRLNSLRVAKSATMQVILPTLISIFSGVIVNMLLTWLGIYSEWEKLIVNASTGNNFKDLLQTFLIILIPLAMILFLVAIFILLSKGQSITFLSDKYHLEDYEVEIIKTKLLELENNTFEKWENALVKKMEKMKNDSR